MDRYGFLAGICRGDALFGDDFGNLCSSTMVMSAAQRPL
jgi:hypothetical protein